MYALSYYSEDSCTRNAEVSFFSTLPQAHAEYTRLRAEAIEEFNPRHFDGVYDIYEDHDTGDNALLDIYNGDQDRTRIVLQEVTPDSSISVFE